MDVHNLLGLRGKTLFSLSVDGVIAGDGKSLQGFGTRGGGKKVFMNGRRNYKLIKYTKQKVYEKIKGERAGMQRVERERSKPNLSK